MKDLKALGFYFDNLNNGRSVYSRARPDGSVDFVSINIEAAEYLSGVETSAGGLVSEVSHESLDEMLKTIGVF